jgi:hypothetical protein
VRQAAATVGSLSDSKFEILFNPDVFQLHVKHAQPEVSVVNAVMARLLNLCSDANCVTKLNNDSLFSVE